MDIEYLGRGPLLEVVVKLRGDACAEYSVQETFLRAAAETVVRPVVEAYLAVSASRLSRTTGDSYGEPGTVGAGLEVEDLDGRLRGGFSYSPRRMSTSLEKLRQGLVRYWLLEFTAIPRDLSEKSVYPVRCHVSRQEPLGSPPGREAHLAVSLDQKFFDAVGLATTASWCMDVLALAKAHGGLAEGLLGYVPRYIPGVHEREVRAIAKLNDGSVAEVCPATGVDEGGDVALE